MKDLIRPIVPLTLFGCTIWCVVTLHYNIAMVCFFLMFAVILVGACIDAAKDDDKDQPVYNVRVNKSPFTVYYGEDLQITDEQIKACLLKRQPYFYSLNTLDKLKFIDRVKKFIRAKTFKIHASEGVREMPILVSSAAIQLSFGMENYLLPQFEHIHIYPEEFMFVHKNFNVLEGNVSGANINISWKHFLEGFALPTDGQNVGLHEMAHAYYYQNFVCKENTDDCFVNGFRQFDVYANKAFESEKYPGNDLYSDYALSNFQEFWAESIEIFFEKPVFLNNQYPELYTSLKFLLRQDPINNIVSGV